MKDFQLLTSNKKSVVTDILDNRTCWSQLSGALAHCTEELTKELFETLEYRWFRHFELWKWPAGLPYTTPLVFQL